MTFMILDSSHSEPSCYQLVITLLCSSSDKMLKKSLDWLIWNIFFNLASMMPFICRRLTYLNVNNFSFLRPIEEMSYK